MEIEIKSIKDYSEALRSIDSNIDLLLKKGSVNSDVLSIMKEIIQVTRVKNKITGYLNE